jgi:hypothetical protein
MNIWNSIDSFDRFYSRLTQGTTRETPVENDVGILNLGDGGGFPQFQQHITHYASS